MANTVKLSDVRQNISRLMGKKNMPSGTTTDWDFYAQTAFDYAWRYYPWSFSLGVIEDYTPGTALPTDMDLDGWRQVYGTGSTLKESHAVDYARSGGSSTFALMWDTGLNAQTLRTTGGGSVSLLYQRTPPTLDEETAVPFPSVMTIAIGAIIYAKQAANPSRADVTQEWDQFHSELDRHVGRATKNGATRSGRNRYELTGTSTGEI